MEPEARVSGCQERSSTGGAPAEVAPDSTEAQGPALQPPEASPTCLQLTSAPGLPPLYTSELLKFATRSPRRRGGKAPEAPGLTSRQHAQVPGSPRPWAPGGADHSDEPEGWRPVWEWGGRTARIATVGSALHRSLRLLSRPRRSGCANSRWVRGRPARLSGAGLQHQPPHSN